MRPCGRLFARRTVSDGPKWADCAPTSQVFEPLDEICGGHCVMLASTQVGKEPTSNVTRLREKFKRFWSKNVVVQLRVQSRPIACERDGSSKNAPDANAAACTSETCV